MVDLTELNKRLIEVAKKEFGIDMYVKNVYAMTESFFVRNCKTTFIFRESTYKPLYNKSMRDFKLYIGEQKLNEKKFSY